MPSQEIADLIARRRNELGDERGPAARSVLLLRAKKAGLPISESYLAKLEKGETSPTLNMIAPLAAALGVSILEVVEAGLGPLGLPFAGMTAEAAELFSAANPATQDAMMALLRSVRSDRDDQEPRKAKP